MSASPEAPIPLAGMAGFKRNQWQLSSGISGNLRLESVAGFDRNQWQPSRGIRKMRVILAQLGDEAFGGIAFAIVFLRAVLLDNRFRHERNHYTIIRMDDCGAQHLVIIRDRR